MSSLCIVCLFVAGRVWGRVVPWWMWGTGVGVGYLGYPSVRATTKTHTVIYMSGTNILDHFFNLIHSYLHKLCA